MLIKFEDIDKIKFSSSSDPTKILISVFCKCNNKMTRVTEGIVRCNECDKYSEYKIYRKDDK